MSAGGRRFRAEHEGGAQLGGRSAGCQDGGDGTASRHAAGGDQWGCVADARGTSCSRASNLVNGQYAPCGSA